MDLVIAQKTGRIGNRLSLHARAMACAIENGVRLYNPCMDEYAQYFRAIAGDPLCRSPHPRTDGPNRHRQRSTATLRPDARQGESSLSNPARSDSSPIRAHRTARIPSG